MATIGGVGKLKRSVTQGANEVHERARVDEGRKRYGNTNAMKGAGGKSWEVSQKSGNGARERKPTAGATEVGGFARTVLSTKMGELDSKGQQNTFQNKMDHKTGPRVVGRRT